MSNLNDPRVLSWKFQKELEPQINSFLDDYKQNTLVLGPYDLNKEPWRMTAIITFRKYQIKIIEKPCNTLTEITLMKNKFTNLKR